MNKNNWHQRFITIKINGNFSGILFPLSLLFTGSALANTELIDNLNKAENITQYQPYITLELSQNKHVDLEGFALKQQDLSTAFGLGIIKTTALDNNWQLSKSVEINLMRSNFTGIYQAKNVRDSDVEGHQFDVDGSYQEVALIASVKVKKLDVFDNISPYLAASVGLVHANSRFDSPLDAKHEHQWKLGYKLSTGLEFTIGEGNSISLGVGFADDTDI